MTMATLRVKNRVPTPSDNESLAIDLEMSERKRECGRLTHGPDDKGREEQSPVRDMFLSKGDHESSRCSEETSGEKSQSQRDDRQGGFLQNTDGYQSRDSHGYEAGGHKQGSSTEMLHSFRQCTLNGKEPGM